MAELVIFGVPDGFDISESSNPDIHDFLGLFYTSWEPGVEFKAVRRPNNDVHYIMLVHENPGAKFLTAYGRPGSFFGMSLVFHNQYSTDANKMFKLLQATYNFSVKNQLISEAPNGTRKWLYANVSSPDDLIANYVTRGLQKIVNANPQFKGLIKPLPPVQNQIQRD